MHLDYRRWVWSHTEAPFEHTDAWWRTTGRIKELFTRTRYASDSKPLESPQVELSSAGRRVRGQVHVGKRV
jgi:hypothetical protein